jgi:hypothetical protein
MCISHFIFRISFRIDGNHRCTTWDRRENSHREIFYNCTYGAYHVRYIANNSVAPNVAKVLRNFEVMRLNAARFMQIIFMYMHVT